MIDPKLNSVVLQYFGMKRVPGEYGVELEIEGQNLPTGLNGWLIKPENSLRGAVHGIPGGMAYEYVTVGALSVKRLEEALSTLEGCFHFPATTPALLTPSDRCSIHIHKNMQQRTFREVFGFVLLFTILEPIVLHLCGPKRNGNLFCLPEMEIGDMPMHVEQMLHQISSGYREFHNRGKYANLNLDPLWTLGSLEVRCFPITVKTSEIMRYVRWLENIMGYVTTCHETYRDMFSLAHREPFALLDLVFPRERLFQICSPNNAADMVAAGLENAYEIYRVLLPHFDYVDKKVSRKTKIALKYNYEMNDIEPPYEGDDI